jgi:biopolymer transport protein ExbD
MFQSIQRKVEEQPAAVDIAPLIDIVFILLVFFLVTATFTRERALDVRRPEAVRTDPVDRASMRITVMASGTIYADGRHVELEDLPQRVAAVVEREKRTSVVLISDREVSAGKLVEVIDAARIGGATEIAVAAATPENAR